MPSPKTAAERQLVAFALLGLVMVLWSGNAIVGRAVRGEVPPMALAFGRWAIASLILLPFAVRPLRREWTIVRQGWLPIVMLGLFGVGAFNALFYTGLKTTTAANALLLQAATPAVVMLLDRLIFGVRGTALQAVGVLFSTLGVVVIVFEGDPAHAARLHMGVGDLWVLGAVLVWSFYTVLLRLRPPVSGVTFVATTFIVGLLAMTPLAAAEWLAGERVQWTGGAIAAFAYVGVLPSIVSYFIFNAATRTVGAAASGQAITLMPVMGAFLSAVILGEKLQGYHFLGMALIAIGIALTIVALRRQGHAGAAAGAPLEDGA